ncbi:NAD(P)-dependent oxidoreductase [Pendulispora albinea]|uniref:NAD(P)-binding domain-containing protein n=1 Tax=Pendulispora albinea TaxID=2741071 RepID=A0ABZ2LME0_9BACT
MKTNSNEGNNRAPVTVIGLGAMGQALASAFLKAGHPVTVWNRSTNKGNGLVAQGAIRAATAADAAKASPIVVACVVDYAAGQAILEPIAADLKGRVLVNLTSDTPERSRETAAWAARHHIDYIDGAVMVPTITIGQPDALLLYSGSQEAFEKHRETLRVLGGNAKFVGADPGAAALFDLALLDLFYSSMASLVHAIALVNADGVSAETFFPYANDFLAMLPAMAPMVVPAIDARKYPGDLDNIRMEAVGIDHIIEASKHRGVDTTVIESVKSVFDRAIAKGHGSDSLSAIFEVLKKPAK